MKKILVLAVILFMGCQQQSPEQVFEVGEENWSKRAVDIKGIDSLISGKTYLSVYSQMYSFSQKQKFDLTAMISMRNVSDVDTIYFLKADYYNTHGEKIRTYFDYPIIVLPMETLEIVIDQKDVEGGTGSNFLFEWKIPSNSPEPLFEGVMSSMQGTQGVSFTTIGRRIL